jgi:hypothetical protein
MSSDSTSQATQRISNLEASIPVVQVDSSTEPMEDSSSHGENNSVANQESQSIANSESVSGNVLVHERQPSPMGPPPAPRVEVNRAPSIDPYLQAMLDQPVPAPYNLNNLNGAGTSRAAAGPSNVNDHFSWGSMMEREFGIGNPNMIAREPVERNVGMTVDEYRQMQALTDSLAQIRERVNDQATALEGAYFHAEVGEMIAKGARDAIERVIWMIVALIMLVLALMVKMFL